MSSPEVRYSFLVEYFDQQASLTRTYHLYYYMVNNTIEMYDVKTRRCFLKRCAYPSLSLKEVFVGATINVFSRPLKVVDYGDEFTRGHFTIGSGEFMVGIAERGLSSAGRIIERITTKELRIKKLRMLDIPSDLGRRTQLGRRCIILVVGGSGAVEKANELMEEFGGSLMVIGDPNDEKQIDSFLGPSKTTAVMKNCAVCVIKPHAITSGYHGPIIQRLIDEGFIISALGMYAMTVADAEDFLEVYNGVVPEYSKLVEQLSSGSVIAIEVCAANAVPALRAVCGPHDPEICHVLFPHTLRSKFGVDRTRNGVHCTDLEEDGPLESEFFFSLLQNKEGE
eukprot:gene5401-3888_t